MEPDLCLDAPSLVTASRRRLQLKDVFEPVCLKFCSKDHLKDTLFLLKATVKLVCLPDPVHSLMQGLRQFQVSLKCKNRSFVLDFQPLICSARDH